MPWQTTRSLFGNVNRDRIRQAGPLESVGGRMNRINPVTVGSPRHDTGVLGRRTLAARSADVVAEFLPFFSIGPLHDVARFGFRIVLPAQRDLRRGPGKDTQLGRRVF